VPTDFTLPELGEQIESGDVLRVLVKPGDTIAKDQAVLELETDKATIEVPSSVAGKVKEIKVKAGDKVKVGQAILSVEDQGAPKQDAAEAEPAKAGGAGAAGADGVAPKQTENKPATAEAGDVAKQGSAKNGPAKAEAAPKQAAAKAGPAKAEAAPKPSVAKPEAAKAGETEPNQSDATSEAAKAGDEIPDMQPDVQAQDKSSKPDKAGVKDRSAGPQAEEPDTERAPVFSGRDQGREGGGAGAQDDRKVVDINRGARAPAEAAAPANDMPPAPAAPSVRRMARELGVDVNEVSGSGAGGRISVEDVKEHTKRLVAGGAGAAPRVSLPDFTRWGPVERQPMRAVRRKTAEHLTAAWATIPHVTQFDLADITGLEELRKKYTKQVEAAGGNLTVTAVAVKVVAAALRVFPQFNASIDLAANEIIVKKYVNIGIAVDTDRGLLVPVIRDADRKNIVQLSVELAQLSEKARTRKISLEEMQGGCFSISNLGGIGGTYFTPIVNAPEVAILGISRARTEPVYDKDQGQFVPRFMLPLSLSYDHRVVDGADGIRFLRWVAEALEQPFLLSLQG
jgi:pyruvate dehydrogenase E2 component (dihydrolipoamide acetyltransferase)